MKVTSLIFASMMIGTASAGIPYPEVTIGLNVGEGTAGSKLGGLEPKVKWQTGGSVIGLDVEGGFDMDITTTDAAPAPSFWGKLKKSFSDGDVSIRGDVDSAASDFVALDVRAFGFGTAFQMLGRFSTKDKAAEVSKVQLSKSFVTPAGVLFVNPVYDIKDPSSAGDIRVGYSPVDSTSFEIDAGQKKLTVSHSFDSGETVTPSVTAAGDLSITYSRKLSTGKLSTTYTPNDSIKLQWTDGEWQTTVKAPLEGYINANDGLKVNMKRTVGMF